MSMATPPITMSDGHQSLRNDPVSATPSASRSRITPTASVDRPIIDRDINGFIPLSLASLNWGLVFVDDNLVLVHQGGKCSRFCQKLFHVLRHNLPAYSVSVLAPSALFCFGIV